MKSDVGSRSAIAFAWTATVAVPIYATVRAAQKILLHEPNPATVIWSPHSGFFWRSWTVVYTSGASFALAYLLTARRPTETARWLEQAIAIAVLAMLAQAVFAP